MPNIFKTLLGTSASDVVKEVGKIADKFIETPEEKRAFQASIEQMVAEKWKADMSSTSWLSKNIRPMTLALVMVTLVVLTFFDGAGLLTISERWIGLWELVSISVVGGYFAVRTIDKRR
jgi:hypothetical protein|tara:strand:- start:8581 stop:8937 length:357 start_codon:yes stop_codon:yes gene_type:complete